MKKCHACGQKLPIQLGNIVEGRFLGEPFRGIVTSILGDSYWVKQFNTPSTISFNVAGLTRLHGYYRITEREPLS